MDATNTIHPFEKAGLGLAPFCLTSVRENWYTYPGGKQPGGTCDFCSTGIAYEYWVKSADGKTFKVGCDCIARLDFDPVLKAAAKAEQLRHARAARGTKKAAERKTANEKRTAERAATKATRKAAYVAANAEFVQKLTAAAGENNFLAQMVASIEEYGSLTERQQATAERILETIQPGIVSQHVGTIGQKVTLTLTTEKVIDISFRMPNGYAPSFRGLHICHDENGNTIVYRGSSSAVPMRGCTNKVTAKIEAHTDYQGKKQTEIKLPRLVEEIKTIEQVIDEETAAERAPVEPETTPEPASYYSAPEAAAPPMLAAETAGQQQFLFC